MSSSSQRASKLLLIPLFSVLAFGQLQVFANKSNGFGSFNDQGNQIVEIKAE